MSAAEILAQAKRMYIVAETSQRDEMLRIGQLLQEFLLLRLKTGDGLTCTERLKRKISREVFVREAADALDVHVKRINGMIRTTQAVQLLGDGTSLGAVGYMTISRFGLFVTRAKPNAIAMDRGELSLGEREQWQRIAKHELKARALFRQAIEETWSNHRALNEISRLVYQKRDQPFRSRITPASMTALTTLKAGVAKASPGDVAQMCDSLIKASQEPEAVALRLRVLLENYLPQKARS